MGPGEEGSLAPAAGATAAEQLPLTGLASGGVPGHTGVDWSRVRRTSYVLHQQICYTYPSPITNLRHRLMIVPPARYGDQERRSHRVDIQGAVVRTGERLDDFGNHIIEVTAERVQSTIEFEASIVVERAVEAGPLLLPAESAGNRNWLDFSALTRPDDELRVVAKHLAGRSWDPGELARRISGWVYRELTYEHDVTTIGTTASEALAIGRGVCQDYAHVMLSLCRLSGLPARYVSGHLLGEGGSHAWVEVLLPDAAHPGLVSAVPLDPTRSGRPGLNYVTIAVGRDYFDVAPTSGTFSFGPRGQLSVRKRLGLTAVEFAAA